MAVLIFMASYMPNSPIRVFVFSIPLKYIALAFIFIDLVQIPTSNAGGHIAHLGGALWGYVYQRQFLQGNDIGGWFMNTYEALKKSLKGTPKSKRPKRRAKATTSNAWRLKEYQILEAILLVPNQKHDMKDQKAVLGRSSKILSSFKLACNRKLGIKTIFNVD